MKSLFRSPFVIAIVGYIIWGWMSLIAWTTRWTIEGDAGPRQELAGGATGLILACWHESIMIMPSGWLRSIRQWPERHKRVAMMSSLSPDGQAMVSAVRHLNLDSILGSSANKKKANKDKGGLRAIADASRRLKEGGMVCMTVDGPRGPRRIASAGAISICQRAGAAVVPYGLALKPAPRLNSWDRFILPTPFGRGAIVFGPPIQCPREADPEDLRLALQAGLEAATRRAEELAGVTA